MTVVNGSLGNDFYQLVTDDAFGSTRNYGYDNDILLGNAGNDQLESGFANDYLYGGQGIDTLIGGPGNDSLFGGDGVDSLLDGDGNDRISGGSGNDFIYADAGNDVIDGGEGFDELNFGFIHFNFYGQADLNYTGVTFDLNKTGPQNLGALGVDRVMNVESVQGGGGNDTFYGTARHDGLTGNANYITAPDADLLDGRGGADLIRGNGGADTLIGGLGKDTIYAASGSGSDGYRDKFVYRSIFDSGVAANTRDDVYDFVHGAAGSADRIDLHLVDADPNKTGNQAFKFGTSFHAAIAGEVRVVDQGPHILVLIDNDADAAAEASILVRNVATLSKVDFIL